MPGQDLRHLVGQTHPEAEIGHVPGHVVGGGGVGDRAEVAYLVPGRRAGQQHDGGRAVREERVGHDLLSIHRGWLYVQAGQLDAEEQCRSVVPSHEVGHHAEPGQRRVAAHVPDEQPLGGRRHAQVAGEQDVQPRRHVAGTGADGEQPDLGRRDPGVGQRPAHRLLAQRHRLGQVPAHPPLSGPAAGVLQQRVDRGVPPHHARVAENALGQRAGRAGIAAGEVAGPDLLLSERARVGKADTRDHTPARQAAPAGQALGPARQASGPTTHDRTHQRGADPSLSGSPPSAATPSQSAHTSEVAGCNEPQRASR